MAPESLQGNILNHLSSSVYCIYCVLHSTLPAWLPPHPLSLGQENLSFLSGLKLSNFFLVTRLVCGWHWLSRLSFAFLLQRYIPVLDESIYDMCM